SDTAAESDSSTAVSESTTASDTRSVHRRYSSKRIGSPVVLKFCLFVRTSIQKLPVVHSSTHCELRNRLESSSMRRARQSGSTPFRKHSLGQCASRPTRYPNAQDASKKSSSGSIGILKAEDFGIDLAPAGRGAQVANEFEILN